MCEIGLENQKEKIWKGLGVTFVFFLIASILTTAIPQFIESPHPPWLFSVHLIAPTSSPIRMRPDQLLEEDLHKIGINAELDWISWAASGSCTDQEVGMYSEGGYDIFGFGLSLADFWDTPSSFSHPGLGLATSYHSSSIPPNGLNTPYWSPEIGKGYNNYRAQESDNLIDQINSNTNVSEVKELFVEWQKVWYDVMPNIVIYTGYDIHAISSGFYGYDPSRNPLDSVENFWFDDPSKISLIFTSNEVPDKFNCILGTESYNSYCTAPITDRLLDITPSSFTVIPNDTDRDIWMMNKYGKTESNTLYPRLASSIGNYSLDGLQYNLTIQEDIVWHDGKRFDAWDVAFSYQARLCPVLYEFDRNFYYRDHPFGVDNKLENNGNYSFIVEDKNTDGFSESICFQLQQKDVGFEFELLTMPLVPEHILGDPVNHGFNGSGEFNVTQWLVHLKNGNFTPQIQPETSDPGGYAGPIGLGPMVFKELLQDDPNDHHVILEKFEGIMWDGNDWIENTSNNYFNVDDLTEMPEQIIIKVSSLNQGLKDLKSYDVNILDPQFHLASVLDELILDEDICTILYPKSGWYAYYMNPKFEENGTHHLNKKGVRHAISHITARLDIIKYLMNNLGTPAYTPLPVDSWAAIPESDLIEYKRNLLASDGTKPLANSSTAYDEYSVNLALDWLETEGYDVDYFRSLENDATQSPSIFELLSDSILFNPNFYNGGMILTIIVAAMVFISTHEPQKNESAKIDKYPYRIKWKPP